ncbi:MAG: hypothetical protein U1F29_15830 [Planctomycetota bacterium]
MRRAPSIHAWLLFVALAPAVAAEDSAPRRGATPNDRKAELAPRDANDARPKEASAPRARRWTLEQILEALRRVETGGEKDGGRHSTGDSGGAIGPYQIHRAYWLDARLPGRWEDCRDPRYARAVVLAYWKRYCPDALAALDVETLVRVHNGGPDGAKETSTVKFWRKVERALVELDEKRLKALEAGAKRGDAKPAPASAPKPQPPPPPAPKRPASRAEWV